MMTSSYVGRFAPTPSGPLHFGSIIAALGSYLDARANGGRWLLRIDDNDTPRVAAGAGDDILRTLEVLGLHWDAEVLYQSARQEAYLQALAELQARKTLYPCDCPRRLTRGRPYPGTCRTRGREPRGPHALRIVTGNQPITLVDAIQGESTLSLADHSGDFIVRRSDGVISYNLVVVIDDHWQGVNHIIRGADLLDTTHCQIFIGRALGYPDAAYGHLPVASTQAGRKISKTEGASAALLGGRSGEILVRALSFLGQEPATGLADGTVEEILQYGVANWRLEGVPGFREILV